MRFGIRAKLLGAFGVVMLMAVVTGAVGIANLNRANELGGVMYDDPLVTIHDLSDIRAKIGDINNQAQLQLLDPNEANGGKDQVISEANVGEVDRFLSEFEAGYVADDEKQSVATLKADWAQYQDELSNINKASSPKDPSATTRYYLEQVARSLLRSTLI